METILEIGGHCADCAAGFRAAAELLSHEAAGRWLSNRAQFWEDSAKAIARQAAADEPSRAVETVRASLYRARVKIRSAIHDMQAIIDDCHWWDSLTRAHCAKAVKTAKNAALAELLSEISGGASARATFDGIHRQSAPLTDDGRIIAQ
jgi:hypothetical protein